MPDQNLLRPPVLNLPSTNHEALSNDSIHNPPTSNPINENQLTEMINRLVINTLRREGRAILQSLLNPGADINNDVDQRIDSEHQGNLSEMDKIPDVVKSLREFSGQSGEFSSWKKSVERILRIYEHLKGTPKYYGILNVIRNKITGHADIALESYNTPLNWEKISKCLTLHYADKRDLGTLEYQMTTLIQGRHTIPEFYQMVYQHLSLILNKLSSMEMSQESLSNMTQAYRDKALDTFVRGLKGDLPRLLSMKEPMDLPQALHLCLKLENVDYRVQHANHPIYKTQFRPTPPIPPRTSNTHRQQTTPTTNPRTPFYPELVHNPQSLQRPSIWHQNSQFYPPARQPTRSPSKPMPRPEPMDIDQSIHSRRANYQNYQNRNHFRQFVNKRPPSQQIHQPHKYQRVHHVEQSQPEDCHVTRQQQAFQGITENEYEQDIRTEDLNHEQDLVDYANSSENSIFDPPERLDDIYFLG